MGILTRIAKHFNRHLIEFPEFFEIKHPFAHLTNGESNLVMVELRDGKVLYFYDIPVNHPRWQFGLVSKDEAHRIVRYDTTVHGWTVVT
jgi:hypothetical protein